ncbi:hypothetical protein BH11MYX3_BH11MYX3_24060 [soil metagenome]
MGKGKPTPEKSKIQRVSQPLAYSRRQKGSGDNATDDKAAEAKPDEAKPEATADALPPADPAKGEAPADVPAPVAAEDAQCAAPAIEPPPPKAEPWPDATPQPMRPVEAPARARSQTIAMPPELALGAPPAVPEMGAGNVAGTIEEPTQMPGPRDVPGGNVTDPAPPPGLVPAGDSRSLRKGSEFALIYRQGAAVITRFGTVGQRGQWRVVEYPTPASASNSYAKEVSRYIGEGFSDYRA